MVKRSKGEAKPTVIEQVAEMAMVLGGRHLADYGATRSRHDFTQRQLMGCLILRAYLKTTYRGVLELLAVSPQLRRRLGLEEKLPHFTTLQKFSARSSVVEIAKKMVASIGAAAARAQGGPQAAAMDSTGLATTVAGEYFRSRTGKRCSQWVKVSAVVCCGSLLPLGLELSLGPSNDRVQVAGLLDQAEAVSRPGRLYADAGYDAEKIHRRCRDQWGVESVIKPASRCADGTRKGKWRATMSPEYLKARGYGRRWNVESYFSALKRTAGHALAARKSNTLLAEAAFMVLAYALRR